MALFVWKDEYSVGIQSIDDQHKKLVAILNELHSAMLEAKVNTILENLLLELIDYTKTHFKKEEDLMIDFGYSDFISHKEIHRSFTAQMQSYYDEFKQGKKLLSVNLLFFLKDWLVNHISGIDKKYSSFFIEKGIK